jgi:hypothetical protein
MKRGLNTLSRIGGLSDQEIVLSEDSFTARNCSRL